MKSLKFTLLLILLSLITSGIGQNSDWKSWRGPNADGTTNDKDWNPDKVINGEGILWYTNVGTGHSSVSVSGDKLYTIGNWEISDSNFIDRIVCLDVNSGELIWKYEYEMDEMEDPGPFSTPVLNGDKLYTLGRGGQLFCFNAENGDIHWSKELIKLGLTKDNSEFACTPVFIDELMILNINLSGMALDKNTGEVVWNSEPGQRSLSTAVEFTLNGKKYFAIQGDGETRAIDAESGEVIWMVPEGHICDPLFVDNDMIVYSYKGSSRYTLDISSPKREWKNDDIKAQFQSYVTNDGYSYGFANNSGMKLLCHNNSTGEIVWMQKMQAGSLILSNNTLIVIDKKGVLHFIEASPEGYSEIGSAEVIELAKTELKGRGYRRISGCWTNPVICNKKIFVRSSYGDLVCLDVS